MTRHTHKDTSKLYCPMCGRTLRLGTYCGYDGFHMLSRKCLACKQSIHAYIDHAMLAVCATIATRS